MKFYWVLRLFNTFFSYNQPIKRQSTGRTVDRPVRNPDRDGTGTERPVAGIGSIYDSICFGRVTFGLPCILVKKNNQRQESMKKG